MNTHTHSGWVDNMLLLLGFVVATLFFIWAGMLQGPQKAVVTPAEAAGDDFILTTTATDTHIWAGDIGTRVITAHSVGPQFFQNPIVFTATGFPDGVTWNFSRHCLPTCTTILTFDTTDTMNVGTFIITVAGSNGSVTKTTRFTLYIKDYTFTCLPFQLSLVIPTQGEPQPVTIQCTATALPTNISRLFPQLTFTTSVVYLLDDDGDFLPMPDWATPIRTTINPGSCTPSPSCSTTITFIASRNTPPGVHAVDVFSDIPGNALVGRRRTKVLILVLEQLPPPTEIQNGGTGVILEHILPPAEIPGGAPMQTP